MNKHTPGPWRIPMHYMDAEGVALIQKRLRRDPPRALTNEGQCYVMAGTGDDEKRVALVDCQTERKRREIVNDCAERDANALLIAAAPDLLKSLRDLVAHEEWCQAMGESTINPETLQKAMDAIAKAIGAK